MATYCKAECVFLFSFDIELVVAVCSQASVPVAMCSSFPIRKLPPGGSWTTSERVELRPIACQSEMMPAMFLKNCEWLPCFQSWLAEQTMLRAPHVFLPWPVQSFCIYQGDVEDTSVRVYEEPVCGQRVLFRPVVDPILIVECVEKDELHTNITLTTLGGNVVFEQSYPTWKGEPVTVADIQKCAQSPLRASGFMSKSARIKLIGKDQVTAPLEGYVELIRAGGTDPDQPKKRRTSQSAAEREVRKKRNCVHYIRDA